MRMILALVVLLTGACKKETAPTVEITAAQEKPAKKSIPQGLVPDTAIFAGGCFWCMEGPFEKTDGVFEVISGYTGGHVDKPSYEMVGGGKTGHREAVIVLYDSSKIGYDKLVEIFWMQIDPTDAGGQFADRGFQYTTAIFVRNENERSIAEASKTKLGESGRFDAPIVTPIIPASPFFAAEAYHQDYYLTNSEHYHAYRRGSGRAGYLEKTWGKAH